MCGIFGVWGHSGAASLTRLGLYALQHRGQESAGIVAVGEDGVAHSLRKMGLVSEAFTTDELERLDGRIAIGHTRYSTAGTSSIENAQPVLARFREGHLALAHNGNLINAVELRRELEDRGAIFSSSMDSEVLVHRLARSSAVAPEHRLADALARVEGAYSLLVLIGQTLLAARDPRGWRPLVIGRGRRCLGCGLRDLRPRHRGGDADARSQAGRDRRHRSATACGASRHSMCSP